MIFSQAGLIPAPIIAAPRRAPPSFYPEPREAGSDSDSQPPHITYKGHVRCVASGRPNGLSSGLSRVARGLATPNIYFLGHQMPKTDLMGRRRHFVGIPRYVCFIPC